MLVAAAQPTKTPELLNQHNRGVVVVGSPGPTAKGDV